MDNHELETAHLEEEPHRSYRVSSAMYNYVDDTYHRMATKHQQKVRVHKVVHSAYFKEYEGWRIHINNAVVYAALSQLPKTKNFDDVFISSSSTTTAMLYTLTSEATRHLSPLSRSIYLDVRSRIQTKMNIDDILKKIPAHIKVQYFSSLLAGDPHKQGAALCLPHIAHIAFSDKSGPSCTMTRSSWYELTVHIAREATQFFYVNERIYLQELVNASQSGHDTNAYRVSRPNPRPTHLGLHLYQDMEWNAIKAVVNEQTSHDFTEYLASELQGLHNLLLVVDAKLKHWRNSNATCITKNTLTIADVHMIIHAIKFFSPRRTGWRLTRELFRIGFTMSEMHDAACCIQYQPLRDNMITWIAQHYRLIMAIIDEDIGQQRLPSLPRNDWQSDPQTDSDNDTPQVWWENQTPPRASTWTPIQRFPSVTYHIQFETSMHNTNTVEYVPDLSVD